MRQLAPILRETLASGGRAILISVVRAEGSTPREAGATMLVTPDAAHGTIGGGQLEFHAIDVAREMLATELREKRLDLPLGPHLGQCCGGRVELLLRPADEVILAGLWEVEAREARARPQALLFGAGHVGVALARSLALLPLAVTLVDDRDATPPFLPDNVAFARVDDPEKLVVEAPASSAFIVLTHSHSLDYRLADAALRKADAAYVGMIGSATKRVRFERWFLARGGKRAALERFICPIGGKPVRDKRPEIIAALATAEILAHLLGVREADASSNKAKAAATSVSGARVSGAKIGRHIRAA